MTFTRVRSYEWEWELGARRLWPIVADTDRWGAERRGVLTLLLHAAREGLPDLQWRVIHGTREEASSLDGLSAGNVHCSTCMVDFDTDLERSVERLDYFGSTVNLAAQLVMSDAVRRDPRVARLLEDEGLPPKAFRWPVRGVEGELALWRTRAERAS